MHQASDRRHNPPADQYSRDPNASSDLVQQQIAGDFKYEVAEKENAEDQSELLAGDGQRFVHRQRRKPNVIAIDKGDDEKHENKRKDPKPQFLNRLRSDRDRGDCGTASHTFSVRESDTSLISAERSRVQGSPKLYASKRSRSSERPHRES